MTGNNYNEQNEYNERLENWRKLYNDHYFSNDVELEDNDSTNEMETQFDEEVTDVPTGPAAIQYVGFWKRFIACVIDTVVFAYLYLVIKDFWASFAIFFLYYSLLTSSSLQGTLGKAAVGAKVVDKEGNKISFLRSIGRVFSLIISGSLLFIGVIMIAFHQQKRGLHDMVSKTIVIQKNT